MHVSLDCPGCGRRLKVNRQFVGRMVRCPSCGTAYTAPAPSARPVPGPAAFDDAESEELHAPCEGCGVLVAAAKGGWTRCLKCREAPGAELYRLADSAPVEAVFSPPAALSPSSSVTPAAVDPPRAEPPPLSTAADSRCPECGGPMAGDAVVCLGCGFNRATGKRLQTVSKRITLRWDDGNFPYVARLIAFAAVVAACLFAAYFFRDAPETTALLLLLTVSAGGLGGLLLGTFHRVTVTTDPQGTPIALENWWICFFPSSEAVVDLGDFRTIRLTHREASPGPAAILLALGLCLLGGLPAIFFYLHALRGSVFTLEVVSRTRVDGEPLLEPLTLYKGRSERVARGIGDALEQIAGLRYG